MRLRSPWWLVAVLTLCAAPALAQTKKPNLYQLTGNELHGKPHLTYQDARGTLSFAGPDIRTVATDIGDGITCIHRFSLVPIGNQGQAQMYTFTALEGTASFVQF
jgi:hypothetical protein